jgi:hypothetical protein
MRLTKICLFIAVLLFGAALVYWGKPEEKEAVVGLEKLIGKEVTLAGIYGGPGKPADFIIINSKEDVYLKGNASGLPLLYGQRIKATGILNYSHTGLLLQRL